VRTQGGVHSRDGTGISRTCSTGSETVVRQGKPSSFVRANIKGAIRVKRRLSSDYAGTDGVKTVRLLETRKQASGAIAAARKAQERLYRQALGAFEEWKLHGNCRPIVKLALKHPNHCQRPALIAWIEHVTGLRWDSEAESFPGQSQSGGLSREQAALIAIGTVARVKVLARSSATRVSAGSAPKCKVCGHPAIPSEDMCYSHQSG